MQHSSILRFTPAATRTHHLPTIPVDDIPLWAITRSYYEMKQHHGDAHYHQLARRLGTDPQTARKWVMGEWSRVILTMADREDIMDQLATNRTYQSIANELLVDELSLRKWVKRDQEALRASEEFKAEIQIDQAKEWVKGATRPEESKAASSLLTHAQWYAERLYRAKFKPNAEAAIVPMSFNFDLGQNAERIIPSGTIIDGAITPVQSRPDALPAVLNPETNNSDYGASGFRQDFTHSHVDTR